MTLPPIPSEYIIFASAIGTAYIAFQSRQNALEKERDRERYLNDRLKEVTHIGDIWGITIDSIRFSEKKGILYSLFKFIFGGISGESTVVIRYENSSVPGALWDTEGLQIFLEEYETEVEHLTTNSHLDPSVARFKFETEDPEMIENFFSKFIHMEKELR